MNIQEILSKLSVREKAVLCVSGDQLCTAALPDRGIPRLVMTDGTTGVRILKTPPTPPEKAQFRTAINASFDSPEALAVTEEATCFPAGSSLACSWDPSLAEEIGAAVAAECRALGAGVLFGPGLNTRRSPLDGRGFEYYSEDPVLAGDMTAGYVKGLQDHGVGACVKHFVCNNSNYMRTIYDNIVEERALREIFLAAFERVIKKSRPALVMASYNLINGTHVCESRRLLTDILRDEWGYEGMIISDCGAVKDHLKAFRAGLDFEMPHSKIAIDKLVRAVESGEMAEAELDGHCRRVLEVVLRYAEPEAAPVDFAKHHTLARDAAARCAVLLKNETELLPLSGESGGSIAVLGRWAREPVFQGTGCAIVKAKMQDIPLEEIRARTSRPVVYAEGYNDTKIPDEALLAQAEEAAAQAECAVVFAGAMLPPETDDYNRPTMDIEPAQEALIRRAAAVNKNVIVVLMNCESVVMPWIDGVRAVLDMWYCGQGCGAAAAQLLFGERSPGGKLPVTMPRRLEDCPDYLHFPGENHRHLYGEGIYVGYRYYDKKRVEPLFPFGHGLSYTAFTYSDLRFSQDHLALPGEVEVSCGVRNTGERPGSEVVQLYVGDGHARLHRPVRELKAFRRIDLDPGEEKTVTFTLGERDFAYYDPAFSDWVVDSGAFRIEIGSSSADIRLGGEFPVESGRVRCLPATPDGHYLELLRDERAAQALFDCLVEWDLLEREEITDALRQKLTNSFWGLAQHLDLLVPCQVTEEMVQEAVRRMNEAQGT